jgi:predicted outer membrane repeat protein
MVILLLLFVLLDLVAKSNSDVLYVHPTNSLPSSCPSEPCFTLQQYSLSNISTGTTLLFLQGNHYLLSILNITWVSNITLKADQDPSEPFPTIVCTSAVIRGENVTHLRIEGLRFLLNHTGSQMSALHLIGCNKTIISNAVFQGSGNASMATMSAISLEHSKSEINGCTFEGIVGGVIRASRGTELTICGCSFTGNKGTGYSGGVIYAGDSSTVVLDGSIPNRFNHNTYG